MNANDRRFGVFLFTQALRKGEVLFLCNKKALALRKRRPITLEYENELTKSL
nr:MAG TPA: hypothetical protein [Caudoviricetes sp.]